MENKSSVNSNTSNKALELTTQTQLISELQTIIQQGKAQAVASVNSALTITYWHIGHKIHQHTLHGQRADYGKQTINLIAEQLVIHYGKSFEARNLRRMIKFAQMYPSVEIVSPLVSKLSWTHFIVLMSIKTTEARAFYAQKTIENQWSKRTLQYQIDRKAFERQEIADSQLQIENASHLSGSFKQPYLLDFLGLKDGYLENELESALIKELELFILELGNGFTFVERQKRMIIDGDDFYLDLLFYHRKLKRLVAVELKINHFKAAYKGQMELYLNWLNKYERQPHEEAPIGLILCAEAGTEQVELLNMQKDNIMVAEYWTQLPSKALLENKLHSALIEIRQRLADKALLNESPVNRSDVDE